MSQQILISLFGFLQIKAHSSKFYLVFRSRSVLESLRKFGLALNLWKWQCSEGVVWFGFNELFLSLFPDNSWCPYKIGPFCSGSLCVKSLPIVYHDKDGLHQHSLFETIVFLKYFHCRWHPSYQFGQDRIWLKHPPSEILPDMKTER